MDNVLIGKAVEVLDVLQAKIGEGTNYFWPIFVKQQIVEGWVGVISFLILLVLFISIFYSFITSLKKYLKGGNNDYIEVKMFASGGIGFVLGFFVLFTATEKLSDSVYKLTNPEYMAAKTILHNIK